MKARLKSGLIIGLIIFTTLSVLFQIGIFTTWQEKLTDTLYIQQQASNDIAIIAIDDTSINQIGRFPWDRSVYARLLDKLNSDGAPKVIGIDISFLEESDEENDNALADAINNLKDTKIILASERNDFVLYQPIDALEAISQNGYVNLTADSDAVVRKTRLWHGDLRSFSISVAEEYKKLGPVNQDLRINFTGPAKSYNYYSFADVLEGKIDPQTFANKIVLIGATAPDLHDDQQVPTAARMPGVEIQAHTIQTLLDGSSKNSESSLVSFLTIFLISIAASIIFMFVSPILAALLAIGFIVVYILYVIFSFDGGEIRNIIYPILAIILVSITNIIYKYLTENAEKRFIRKTFSYYLSESVLNHLLDNPQKIKLGGERRQLTVLFSDIAGFTSISESMEAHQLAELLNKYLTNMTDIVFANDGVLDKYIGDAVMAFWGAPVENENHAFAACKTALQMQKAIAQNFDFTARVGINTGEMVVGNMGSTQRFDYSLLGDNVNLGSRLEGINKMYGTKICISQSTFDQVKGRVTARKIDTVAVKGKKTGVPIYELVHLNKPTKSEVKFLSAFEQARNAYENGNFKKALAEFKSITKSYPKDETTKIYIDRISELIKNPPNHWDGIYHATSK